MRRLLVAALLLAGLCAPPAVLAQVGTPGVTNPPPSTTPVFSDADFQLFDDGGVPTDAFKLDLSGISSLSGTSQLYTLPPTNNGTGVFLVSGAVGGQNSQNSEFALGSVTTKYNYRDPLNAGGGPQYELISGYSQLGGGNGIVVVNKGHVEIINVSGGGDGLTCEIYLSIAVDGLTVAMRSETEFNRIYTDKYVYNNCPLKANWPTKPLTIQYTATNGGGSAIPSGNAIELVIVNTDASYDVLVGGGPLKEWDYCHEWVFGPVASGSVVANTYNGVYMWPCATPAADVGGVSARTTPVASEDNGQPAYASMVFMPRADSGTLTTYGASAQFGTYDAPMGQFIGQSFQFAYPVGRNGSIYGPSKPTCTMKARGLLWYVNGAAGVADTLEVCRKDAGNAYAWVSLF